MLCTVEEAKTKDCPYKYLQRSYGLNKETAFSQCRADQCMAWDWEFPEDMDLSHMNKCEQPLFHPYDEPPEVSKFLKPPGPGWAPLGVPKRTGLNSFWYQTFTRDFPRRGYCRRDNVRMILTTGDIHRSFLSEEG